MMAISEDGSTPAPVKIVGTTSLTTIANPSGFNIPAGSWLVAMIMLDYNSSGTPIFAMSSTISGNPAWTSFTLQGGSGGFWCQIFILQVPSAQTGIICTCTNTGSAPGMSNSVTWMMDIRVVDGAGSNQTGAATNGVSNAAGTATNFTGSITPTQLQSWVYCTANTDSSESGFTVFDNNTLNINSQTDTGVGTSQITGRYNGSVSSLSALTLGWTGGTPASYAWSGLEILPLEIPASLPTAPVGYAYSYTLTVLNGTSPYTYSVTSGSLPGWASLNTSTGVISGTPSGTDVGSTSFTIGVTDNLSATVSQAYTLTVVPELALQSAWPAFPAPALFVPGQLIERSSAAHYTETLAALLAVQASTPSRRVGKVITGVTAITGTVKRALAKSIAGTLAVLGVVTRQTQRIVTAVTAVMSAVTAMRIRVVVLAGSITAAASLPRTIGRVLSAQTAFTGVLGRSIRRGITAITTVVSSVVRQVQRPVTALATALVSVAASRLRFVTAVAAVVVTAVVNRQVGKPFTAVVVVYSAVARSARRVLVAALDTSGSVTRNVSRVLAGQIAVLASVAFTRMRFVTVTATAVVTGAVSRQVGRPVSAVVVAVPVVVRSVQRAIQAVLTVSGSVTMRIGRSLTAQVVAAASAVASQGQITYFVTAVAQMVVYGAVRLSTGRILTGTILATSNVTRTLTRALSAAILAAAAMTRSITRTIAAQVVTVVAVTFIKAKLVTLAATVGAYSSVTRQVRTTQAAATVVTGVLANRVSRTIAAVIIVTAAVTRSVGRTLNATVTGTVSVVFLKVKTVLLSATVTVTGFVRRNVLAHMLAYAIVEIGTTRTISRAIQGNLTVAGQTLRTVGRGITTGIAIIAAQTAVKIHIIVVSAFMSVSGSVTRRAQTFQTATIVAAVSVGRFIRKTITAVAAISSVFTALTPGVEHFITLATDVSVAVSVVAHMFSHIGTITVKFGLSFVNWVAGQLKKGWRIP